MDAYETEAEVFAAIDNIAHVKGGTNIYAGLQLARNQVYNKNSGDRLDARDIAILITDGQDTAGLDVRREAERVRAAGIGKDTV